MKQRHAQKPGCPRRSSLNSERTAFGSRKKAAPAPCIVACKLPEHGGSDGHPRRNALDSALAKPLNVFAYADQPEIFRLAASVRLRNRPKSTPLLMDNKRTALVVSDRVSRTATARTSFAPKDEFTSPSSTRRRLPREDERHCLAHQIRRARLKPKSAAFHESFSRQKRLTIVVFCDSLGTCAFECPDLPEGHRACQSGLNRNLLPAHYVTTQGCVRPEYQHISQRHPNHLNLSQECALPWLKKLTSTKTT